jgi:alanine adding enzyme
MDQFTKLTEAEFTKQALASPAGNFLQTSEMKHLLEKRGRLCEYVGVKRDEQVIAAAILSKMKIKFGYVYEIDGGIVMDYQDKACVTTFFTGLKKHMKKGKGMYFNFTPNLVIRYCDQDGEVLETVNQDVFDYLVSEGFIHQGFDTRNFEGSPRWCFVKELNGLTESTLFQSYGKAAKYDIKKTNEYGITTRELSYEELPLFFKLTEETSQRRGFANKDLAYYQSVYKEFGDQAKFLVAELNFATYLANLDEKLQNLQATLNKINEALVENPKSRKRNNQKKEFEDEVRTVRKRIDEAKSMGNEQDTEILAGALFIIHPQEVVYLFSGTYEKYKQYYAPYLLQHEMLTFAVQQNIPRYNFYGIDGVFDGSDGVLKFKQSFGGTIEELMGSFQWTLQPFKYSLYSFLKKIKNN